MVRRTVANLPGIPFLPEGIPYAAMTVLVAVAVASVAASALVLHIAFEVGLAVVE